MSNLSESASELVVADPLRRSQASVVRWRLRLEPLQQDSKQAKHDWLIGIACFRFKVKSLSRRALPAKRNQGDIK
jgi:hypothetical protein